jgi:uncharacterized protein YjbJ (UPF0337 family)
VGSAAGKAAFRTAPDLAGNTQAAGRSRWISIFETSHQTEERIMMKPSTNDKAAGKVHEVKGAIKQKAGQITRNPDLEANGRIEKNSGKVQNFVGKVEKAIGN